jgi:hypothetical protein
MNQKFCFSQQMDARPQLDAGSSDLGLGLPVFDGKETMEGRPQGFQQSEQARLFL